MPSKKVGDILPGVMSDLGLDTKLRETQLVHEWREIVGATVAGRSVPIGVKNGVLLIEATNNAWMQEIRFHQREIIARIKETFPELGIEGLRLVLKRERES